MCGADVSFALMFFQGSRECSFLVALGLKFSVDCIPSSFNGTQNLWSKVANIVASKFGLLLLLSQSDPEYKQSKKKKCSKILIANYSQTHARTEQSKKMHWYGFQAGKIWVSVVLLAGKVTAICLQDFRSELCNSSGLVKLILQCISGLTWNPIVAEVL